MPEALRLTRREGSRHRLALGRTILRSALDGLSAGRRQRLSILIYHRVLPESDPLRPDEPAADVFRWQMELVGGACNVLPLEEAVDRLQAGNLPPRAASITFDDGYADNVTEALPILSDAGLPATFFIATGFLNGGRMFNDTVIEAVRRLPAGRHDFSELGLGLRSLQDAGQRRAVIRELLPRFKYATPAERDALLVRLEAQVPGRLPRNLMMNDAQVATLPASGMTVGAHTVSHPILNVLPREQAYEEIAGSRRALEHIIGRSVTLFAYPNGRRGEDYDATHTELVRAAGFRAAVSTRPGSAGPDADVYELPRFTPWDRTPARFAARLALNLTGRTGLSLSR